MYEFEKDEEDATGLCICCLKWTLTRCKGCGVALHRECSGQEGVCGVCARARKFYAHVRWASGLNPLQGVVAHRPLVLLDANRTLELTAVAVEAV